MARVTGQLKSSERIIALRFAVLKSDHIPDAPVRFTPTWGVLSRASGPLSASAARTIAVGSPAAPPMITAVWPSRVIVVPVEGGVTEAMRASRRSTASLRLIALANAASVVVRVGECTTTITAELELPAKLA